MFEYIFLCLVRCVFPITFVFINWLLRWKWLVMFTCFVFTSSILPFNLTHKNFNCFVHYFGGTRQKKNSNRLHQIQWWMILLFHISRCQMQITPETRPVQKREKQKSVKTKSIRSFSVKIKYKINLNAQRFKKTKSNHTTKSSDWEQSNELAKPQWHHHCCLRSITFMQIVISSNQSGRLIIQKKNIFMRHHSRVTRVLRMRPVWIINIFSYFQSKWTEGNWEVFKPHENPISFRNLNERHIGSSVVVRRWKARKKPKEHKDFQEEPFQALELQINSRHDIRCD